MSIGARSALRDDGKSSTPYTIVDSAKIIVCVRLLADSIVSSTENCISYEENTTAFHTAESPLLVMKADEILNY